MFFTGIELFFGLITGLFIAGFLAVALWGTARAGRSMWNALNPKTVALSFWTWVVVISATALILGNLR